MTHCSRCGLISENDELCSWCGATLSTRPPERIAAVESTPPQRDRTVLLVSVILALGLALVLFLRFSKPAEDFASAAPVSSRPTGERRPRISPGMTLPRAGAPHLSGGMSSRQRGERRTLSASGPTAGSGRTAQPRPAPERVSPAPTESTGGTTPVVTATAQGAAHLADARLALGQDGEGQEMAGGRVIIVNEGPYNITDFRVSLQIAGTSYELTPFSGSPDNPVPLTSKTIKAGERVEIPVMTTMPYRNENANVAYRVVLRATLDGPPGTVTDSISVPAGSRP